MNIINRHEWGARRAESFTPNPIGKTSTLFVHWSAAQGASLDTLEEAKAAVRAIQAFHMDARAWSDIGYSYLVVQGKGDHGPWVLKGRGFDRVPAAQTNHNTGNAAVCVLMGPGDSLREQTVGTLRRIFEHFPGEGLRPHSAVAQTECPGDKLRAALPEIKSDRKRPPLD